MTSFVGVHAYPLSPLVGFCSCQCNTTPSYSRFRDTLCWRRWSAYVCVYYDTVMFHNDSHLHTFLPRLHARNGRLLPLHDHRLATTVHRLLLKLKRGRLKISAPVHKKIYMVY